MKCALVLLLVCVLVAVNAAPTGTVILYSYENFTTHPGGTFLMVVYGSNVKPQDMTR